MLRSLEIHALRGATKPFILEFETSKKIAILYGGNGTGKSTICDALELISSDAIGSLDGKGIGRTAPFWHSTGLEAKDLSVVVTTSKGEWTAKVVKTKVVVTPNQPRLQVKILRRSQLLDLIATQPKNRFDAVRPFLDIDAVEASEASLRRLIEQERKGREVAVARIEENRSAVEDFWREAGEPGADPITWARAESQKDVANAEAQIASLENLIESISKVAHENSRLMADREALASAKGLYLRTTEEVVQEEAKISADASELVRVLDAASAYIRTKDIINECPVCGSAENASGLLLQIEQRLHGIRALRAALDEQDKAKRSLDSIQGQVDRQSTNLLDTARNLAVKLTDVNSLPQNVEIPATMLAAAPIVLSPTGTEADRLLDIGELAKDASGLLESLKDTADQLREDIGFLQTLQRAIATYDENYAAQQDLDVLIPRLEKALAEMEDVRRKFVDSILSRIATRVGELYEAIHPKEGLSKVSLLLDPAKRASLEIAAPFPGAADVPPGAYFSESHLDTLGLCIWLALAEMGDAKQTILVLDDVIASVDEQHAERIVELLYDVAQKFQYCVYTTHYRPWREKYRWGWLQNGQCQFVELLTWEHSTGMRHTKHVPPVEELRGLLAADPPSPQQTCASSGVILEAILDFLTELYECSVPRRRGKPNLGDLLTSINKKLRNALKIERREVDSAGNETYTPTELGPILVGLQQLAQTRNIFGCHFNELAQVIPERDAIDFARSVLNLADLLIDTDCGWPKSDKSGMYWANSQQTRRLYPLKQPS